LAKLSPLQQLELAYKLEQQPTSRYKLLTEWQNGNMTKFLSQPQQIEKMAAMTPMQPHQLAKLLYLVGIYQRQEDKFPVKL
jgi:hypothetical protein